MGAECQTYIRVPSETDVRENNKVLMELDGCSIEITRLYKEICQLDNTKKCIEDRLVIALSSLAECRRRYLLLLSETSSNERIGENDSCSFVCGPHDTVVASNLI
jgi:ribulose bisphosphate carboxylase small subunit